MTGRPAFWFAGTAAALFTLLAMAWSVGAETAADGPWRLQLELDSFHHGHIATFDEVIEIRNGRYSGGFESRRTQVTLSLAIAGGAVSGHMAVKPGNNWNTGTRSFQGAVADGVFQREVDVPATFVLHGDEDADYDSRIVAVRMRLERE